MNYWNTQLSTTNQLLSLGGLHGVPFHQFHQKNCIFCWIWRSCNNCCWILDKVHYLFLHLRLFIQSQSRFFTSKMHTSTEVSDSQPLVEFINSRCICSTPPEDHVEKHCLSFPLLLCSILQPGAFNLCGAAFLKVLSAPCLWEFFTGVLLRRLSLATVFTIFTLQFLVL